jgi:diguanylate cyclase (GGDEF)-like protein/PAS domain S-box-containing protein
MLCWRENQSSLPREMAQNILLIQANASDAVQVLNALSKSPDFRIEWVDTCALGLTRLAVLGKQDQSQATGIAAVLVDLQLPDAAGIDAFDRLYAAKPLIPILILSSSQDERIAKLAIHRGAQDYLLKGRLDDYLLPKAIAGMLDRAAITEALFDEKERAQVTLNSIGDAVICTDVHGHVTYLNIVAEELTGWPRTEALGRSVEEVFRIIEASSRAVIPNPMALATNTNEIVALPATCILIRRDGVESAIEDSCAPIHNRCGEVTGAVMVFHDVSMSRAITQKLAHLAQYDSLTDLPNRDLLNERLTQAITAAHRRHAHLAVLYLDLDRFKHINDSLGHATGDRLLQSVAHRLRACIRASDTASRLGGDEFIILLPEISHAQDAAICAEKVIQTVGRPYTIDEAELHITVSIGVAVYPEDSTELKTLLQNADSAMYEAKARGRNIYQFYRADLNSKASERQHLENNLRQAIGRKELELHYQPIVNLMTGAISRVEALLRWRHPTFGAVSIREVISVAEESGLIVPIGQWALREACAQFNDWQRGGLPVPGLAVNVSAVELRSRDFVADVAAILSETGMNPNRLTLELTETFIMQDSQATALVLNALKSLGVELALDDFGTGYSSLSYVRRFPIDVLKVDRSFVLNLSSDADDASVVSAVINMGKSLRMRVIAEGVETAEQVEFLKQNGCSEAQGNHFSHPLKPDAIARFLHQAGNRRRPETRVRRSARARQRADHGARSGGT